MPNFTPFNKLTKMLLSLPMEKVIERAVDKTEDLFIDLNVEQMDQGIRSDDTDIDPEYSPKTVYRKKKIGQTYNKVTLKDTGDFHNSVRVKKYPRKIEMIATDIKSEPLQEKYGPKILGLTERNIGIVRNSLKPLILADVKKVIKSKIK